MHGGVSSRGRENGCASHPLVAAPAACTPTRIFVTAGVPSSVNRRALLRAGLPAAVGVVAGCTGGGPATDSPTDSPTEPSPTATPTDSPRPREPEVIDTSFTVESNDCGSPANHADAVVDGRTVTVTGTIDGSDTCHTARLADASVSEDGAALLLAVEAYVPASKATQACGQCIVEVDYRASIVFERARPGLVVVTHDGKQIAEIALPE